MKIKTLFTIIEKSWDFNSIAYPIKNREMTYNGENNFAINHILLHINKISGDIATEVEHSDHQVTFHTKPLAKIPALLIINAIKLAQIIGISAEQIEQQILDWEKKHS